MIFPPSAAFFDITVSQEDRMRILLITSMLLYCRGCHDAEAVTERGPSTVAPYDPEVAHQKALKAIEDRRRARDAEREAALAEDARKGREVDALVRSMRDYVVQTYCDEPVEAARRRGDRHPEDACKINQRGADRIVRERDLRGFAFLLYDVARTRQHDGRWLPFGDRAPFFLASVAFHEFSWRWRDRTTRGGIGERCAFQVTKAPINNWRRLQVQQDPSLARLSYGWFADQVAHNPYSCVEAAIEWMDNCAQKCGGRDETAFLRVGPDGQPIRRWKNVRIRYRDDVGRWLTKVDWREVVVPTEAARYFGAYATPGICGGAPDVVRERFMTAWWLEHHADSRP